MGRLKEAINKKTGVLKREIYTIYLCYRDSETPVIAKGLSLLVLAYALSPVDLIPDFIPVIGLLDDIILIPAGIALILRLIPREVYEKHRTTATEQLEDPRLRRTGLFLTLGVWLILLAGIGKIMKFF